MTGARRAQRRVDQQESLGPRIVNFDRRDRVAGIISARDHYSTVIKRRRCVPRPCDVHRRDRVPHLGDWGVALGRRKLTRRTQSASDGSTSPSYRSDDAAAARGGLMSPVAAQVLLGTFAASALSNRPTPAAAITARRTATTVLVALAAVGNILWRSFDRF